MNKNKTYIIVLCVLLLPVIFFIFRPELNLDEKYIRFSWQTSSVLIQRAIKEKKPKILLEEIYKNQPSGQPANKENTSEARKTFYDELSDYIYYTRNKIDKFSKKLKDFIS